jgi:ADP-ribose pyrophosphatase YjhB (NUDIX family)
METQKTFAEWIDPEEADAAALHEEADAMVDEIEAWLNEYQYTSRSTGESFRLSPTSGGYWCADHEGSCSRACANRRNGRWGAAGVLFFHRATQTFLLNKRGRMINHGGTWSTLGGALDRDETAFEGAMREVEEEIGMVPVSYVELVAHKDTHKGAHSDWTYTTFVVEVEGQWEPEDVDKFETEDNAWVTISEMSRLPLHPAFKANVHELVKMMYYGGAFA